MSTFHQVLGQSVPDKFWGRSVRSYQPNDAVYNDVRPFDPPLTGYQQPAGLLNRVYSIPQSGFRDAGIKEWLPNRIVFKGFNDLEDAVGVPEPLEWTPSRMIHSHIDNIGTPIK